MNTNITQQATEAELIKISKSKSRLSRAIIKSRGIILYHMLDSGIMPSESLLSNLINEYTASFLFTHNIFQEPKNKNALAYFLQKQSINPDTFSGRELTPEETLTLILDKDAPCTPIWTLTADIANNYYQQIVDKYTEHQLGRKWGLAGSVAIRRLYTSLQETGSLHLLSEDAISSLSPPTYAILPPSLLTEDQLTNQDSQTAINKFIKAYLENAPKDSDPDDHNINTDVEQIGWTPQNKDRLYYPLVIRKAIRSYSKLISGWGYLEKPDCVAKNIWETYQNLPDSPNGAAFNLDKEKIDIFKDTGAIDFTIFSDEETIVLKKEIQQAILSQGGYTQLIDGKRLSFSGTYYPLINPEQIDVVFDDEFTNELAVTQYKIKSANLFKCNNRFSYEAIKFFEKSALPSDNIFAETTSLLEKKMFYAQIQHLKNYQESDHNDDPKTNLLNLLFIIGRAWDLSKLNIINEEEYNKITNFVYELLSDNNLFSRYSDYEDHFSSEYLPDVILEKLINRYQEMPNVNMAWLITRRIPKSLNGGFSFPNMPKILEAMSYEDIQDYLKITSCLEYTEEDAYLFPAAEDRAQIHQHLVSSRSLVKPRLDTSKNFAEYKKNQIGSQSPYKGNIIDKYHILSNPAKALFEIRSCPNKYKIHADTVYFIFNLISTGALKDFNHKSKKNKKTKKHQQQSSLLRMVANSYLKDICQDPDITKLMSLVCNKYNQDDLLSSSILYLSSKNPTSINTILSYKPAGFGSLESGRLSDFQATLPLSIAASKLGVVEFHNEIVKSARLEKYIYTANHLRLNPDFQSLNKSVTSSQYKDIISLYTNLLMDDFDAFSFIALLPKPPENLIKSDFIQIINCINSGLTEDQVGMFLRFSNLTKHKSFAKSLLTCFPDLFFRISKNFNLSSSTDLINTSIKQYKSITSKNPSLKYEYLPWVGSIFNTRPSMEANSIFGQIHSDIHQVTNVLDELSDSPELYTRFFAQHISHSESDLMSLGYIPDRYIDMFYKHLSSFVSLMKTPPLASINQTNVAKADLSDYAMTISRLFRSLNDIGDKDMLNKSRLAVWQHSPALLIQSDHQLSKNDIELLLSKSTPDVENFLYLFSGLPYIASTKTPTDATAILNLYTNTLSKKFDIYELKNLKFTVDKLKHSIQRQEKCLGLNFTQPLLAPYINGSEQETQASYDALLNTIASSEIRLKISLDRDNAPTNKPSQPRGNKL